MGPDGVSGSGQFTGGEVKDGPFAGSSNWPLTLTDDNTPGVSALQRAFGLEPDALELPYWDDVAQTLSQTDYDGPSWGRNSGLSTFRNELEGRYNPLVLGGRGSLPAMHNRVHAWVGGSMNNVGSSPNDPVFWLHHANVDRLWAIWQRMHSGQPPYLPAPNTPNLPSRVPTLNQPMQFTETPFSNPWPAPAATPGQVVDNLPLNYVYEDVEYR
jgi:tyrosinase